MPPKKTASGRMPERRISFEFAAILATSIEHWLRAAYEKTNEFSDELEIQKLKRAPPTGVVTATDHTHVSKGVENLWITSEQVAPRRACPIAPHPAPAASQAFPQVYAGGKALSRAEKDPFINRFSRPNKQQPSSSPASQATDLSVTATENHCPLLFDSPWGHP